MNYQKLEQDINNKVYNSIFYDYIIADEAHYIFSDSTLNCYTDLTYKYLTTQTNNVVVFMSATAPNFFRWICRSGIVKESRRYSLETDYSYVNSVNFYDRKSLIKIIDGILNKSNDEKIIVFVNSEKQMLKMHDYYKDKANYFCSANASKELKNIREANCITVYDSNHVSFEKQILFTTTVLDNGVDLKDEKIKHIISEVFEPDVSIQCVGRKRSLNKYDTCTIYLAYYDYNIISAFQRRNEEILEPLTLLKHHKKEYIEKYGRNRKFHSNYIYNNWDNDGIPEINSIGHIKLVLRKVCLQNMLYTSYIEEMKKRYMTKELVSKTNKDVLFPSINELGDYLDGISGKKLFDTDKTTLIDIIKKLGFKSRTYGLKSINTLFEENNLMYQLVSNRKRINGVPTTYWLLKKN